MRLVLGVEGHSRRYRLDGVEFDFFTITRLEPDGGFGRNLGHERDFARLFS